MTPSEPTPTLFPYTTLFRSIHDERNDDVAFAWRDQRDQWHRLRRRAAARHQRVQRLIRHIPRFDRRMCRMRRSEEHTSELQSLTNLVCRLLLEKKNILSPLF